MLYASDTSGCSALWNKSPMRDRCSWGPRAAPIPSRWRHNGGPQLLFQVTNHHSNIDKSRNKWSLTNHPFDAMICHVRFFLHFPTSQGRRKTANPSGIGSSPGLRSCICRCPRLEAAPAAPPMKAAQRHDWKRATKSYRFGL